MPPTYEIIGGDNRPHGPVEGEDLCQWIREGRAHRNTMVRFSEDEVWRPLYSFPEFSGPLRGLPWTPFYTPPPKTHGLAIASLVLGISSLLIVGLGLFIGIPAAICGHAARSTIAANPGVHGGSGMALAGIITGYLGTFVSGVVFVAVLLLGLDLMD